MLSVALLKSVTVAEISCVVPKSIFSFEELLWNSLLCKTTLPAKDFDNQFALQFKGLWRTHLNINHLKEKNVILIPSYYTSQFPAMDKTFQSLLRKPFVNVTLQFRACIFFSWKAVTLFLYVRQLSQAWDSYFSNDRLSLLIVVSFLLSHVRKKTELFNL